jgi:hypothetical protein
MDTTASGLTPFIMWALDTLWPTLDDPLHDQKYDEKDLLDAEQMVMAKVCCPIRTVTVPDAKSGVVGENRVVPAGQAIHPEVPDARSSLDGGMVWADARH